MLVEGLLLLLLPPFTELSDHRQELLVLLLELLYVPMERSYDSHVIVMCESCDSHVIFMHVISS